MVDRQGMNQPTLKCGVIPNLLRGNVKLSSETGLSRRTALALEGRLNEFVLFLEGI